MASFIRVSAIAVLLTAIFLQAPGRGGEPESLEREVDLLLLQLGDPDVTKVTLAGARLLDVMRVKGSPDKIREAFKKYLKPDCPDAAISNILL